MTGDIEECYRAIRSVVGDGRTVAAADRVEQAWPVHKLGAVAHDVPHRVRQQRRPEDDVEHAQVKVFWKRDAQTAGIGQGSGSAETLDGRDRAAFRVSGRHWTVIHTHLRAERGLRPASPRSVRRRSGAAWGIDGRMHSVRQGAVRAAGPAPRPACPPPSVPLIIGSVRRTVRLRTLVLTFSFVANGDSSPGCTRKFPRSRSIAS